ncbi:MAG: carbamoyltransferase HypF [Bacteroidetes bacterium]|nr:carbamoyltransferase HypF [Bacteroidota bacterium]
MRTVQIYVSGLVQGVGFRPFVNRLAEHYNLKGWVQNTNENVRIRITADAPKIDSFTRDLKSKAPVASIIREIRVENLETEIFQDFTILKSDDLSEEITDISPDIAVCPDCVEDISQLGMREDYAFVNCTNCGPRFTIVRDLPYDRDRTTMHAFRMCPDCETEYHDIRDRRYHAQPTACKVCGPCFEWQDKKGLEAISDSEVIELTAAKIDNGGIVMMKGLGGFHLACNAFNQEAVNKLREIKNRDAKPFALMFRDMESIEEYAQVSDIEKISLLSFRRPIVLLYARFKDGHVDGHISQPMAQGINSGLNLQGIMLPYLPFHYLLFDKLKTRAIVLTSGNLSSEPIIIDNDLAIQTFAEKTDAILTHNREIFNRTDDSVVRIIGGKERLLRRSRGYVPEPVMHSSNADGIIAFGAELSNCFAVGKGSKVILSQHIGDLKEAETLEFYEQTLKKFIGLFRIKPSLLAVDMHPDYVSTRLASKYQGIPVTQIQHHHAHIASCMAEHQLEGPVIGVALDGTGYGTDGNIWGGEILKCDLLDFSRLSHISYIPLPGGDLANEEPWRVAISYLYKIYGRDFLSMNLPFLMGLDREKVEGLLNMIKRNINSPLSSGAGRLFDAVASLLGLCQVAAFSAQGPMLLESMVDASILPMPGQKQGVAEFEPYFCNIETTVMAEDLIEGVVNDLLNGKSEAYISTRFHSSFISAIFEKVKLLCRQENLPVVVLSGGVFQNRYVLEGLTYLLEREQINVYSQQAVPSNDGGIALGQIAIAAKRRQSGCV